MTLKLTLNATRRLAPCSFMVRPAATAAMVVGMCFGGALEASAQQRIPGNLPPNPDPNACYARVWIPGETRQEPTRVIVREEAERLIVQPAEYEYVNREVEIETAAQRIELIPARFEDQMREIEIEPERREIKVIEPVYATIEQPVLVRPAYQAWQRCTQPVERIENSTGEVMCFQTVPAEFRTIRTQVLREPARLDTRVIPRKTKRVKVRVMVEPPRQRVVQIPPKTQTMRVLEEVRPLRTTRERIEPIFETVMQTVPATPGRVEWVPILCESNARPGLIRDIQRALRARGFDPGPIDGVIGSRTLSALQSFQRSNNLPEGGLIIDSLRALGVDLSG